MRESLFLIALLIPLSLTGQVKFDTTASGLPYVIFTENNTKKIHLRDVIIFNFKQVTESGELLYSTYQDSLALKIQITPPQHITDLMEFLLLLHEKDSAMVKIPSDTIFEGYEEFRPPSIPKGSPLLFFVKIEKVQTMDELLTETLERMERLRKEEIEKTARFLAKSDLKPIFTASGLGYVVVKRTERIKPAVGDTVLVNFMARTLDGRFIESNRPEEMRPEVPGIGGGELKFTAGKGEVIRGWDEGILLMTEGSIFKFIIPSKLAFGMEGSGEAIPPFTTILLEVELVKIIPAGKARARRGQVVREIKENWDREK